MLIEKIDDFIFGMVKPRVFIGKESAEIQYEKEYRSMCLLLESELSVNTKNMTVIEFLNGFEYLKKTKK